MVVHNVLRHIACLPLLFFLPLLVQAKDDWKKSPEDLLAALSQAKGKEKVVLLNKLASYYINSSRYKPDSALYYAEQALYYAKSINDTNSYARTAEHCATISLQLSQVNKGLEYYQQAYQLAPKTSYPHLQAIALRGIGHALWYSGKFKEAADTMLKVSRYFQQARLYREYADAIMVISTIYSDMGNYEKAFEIAQHSYQVNKDSGMVSNIILSLVQLGHLYKNTGDYPTALSYFQQAFAYKPPSQEWCFRHLCNRIGDLYLEQKKYDSALYYYRQSIRSHAESKTSLLRMADYFLATGQYEKASDYYGKVYHQLKNTGEGNLLVFAMIGVGKTAMARKKTDVALRYGYKALNQARLRDTRLTLRDAYQLLSSAYEAQNKADSAFAYYKKYMAEKEAVVSDQFKGKMFAYKQASEFQLLANEKLLAEQNLKSSRLWQNILIGGSVVVLLLALIVVRNVLLKRKNEKLQSHHVQAALKQRASEMEMQALRAQMNPHFIFNALSSINRFILKNDPEKASDYLTRFSRLIRLVLINSQRESILLEEEMEMLRLYLQMEQLRFRHAFDFSINVAGDIDAASVFLPPMLLQPFCENAIWHGLMHREAGGHLQIDFWRSEDFLHCTIVDNGVGRARSAEMASKSAEKIKSLGLRLTKDRLAIFNKEETDECYTIDDVKDEAGNVAGTTVNLQIRYQTFVQSRKLVATC